MSTENKTQLQTNNTALASLTDRVLAAKDTAAALPDAGGGGGSKKTVTVTVTGSYYNRAYYMDENGISYAISSNGQTVEALGGVIYRQPNSVCTMSCISGSAYIMTKYSSNGDIAICTEDGTVIDLVPSTGGGGI